MDAVGADQDIAARGMRMCVAAIEEIGAHPTLILGEGTEAASRVDGVPTQPFEHGLMDDPLQAAAMDGKLRDLMAGIEPAFLVPDLLTMPSQIKQLRSPD